MKPPYRDSSGTMHETCELHFYLGAKDYGIVPYDPGNHPALGYRRTGTTYVCPYCGEVWAKISCINSKGKDTGYEVSHVSCPSHPDQWSFAGSLLSGYRNEALLTLLPFALLRREVLLTSWQWEQAYDK